MLELSQGNLLTAPVEALVNTVNTEGVMGKGIALQFRQAYPEMFRAYEKACARSEVSLGKMHLFDRGGLDGNPRWIINFPTKGHWRSSSKLADIAAGLDDLVAHIRTLGIRSIAVPPLGCGNGGLDWADVSPLIERAFAQLPEVAVHVYPPAGAPVAEAMPNRTAEPKMTLGQAALVGLMDRYLKGLLDPFVSLVEVQKLMYFLKAAGEPIPKLVFSKHIYGPYAANLGHSLKRMESHFTSGYGDGSDKPTNTLELLPGAVEKADAFLADKPETRERMECVTRLIAGFEDPYGMELLSSVHWVMQHDEAARESADAAVKAVHGWSERKHRILKPEHLHKAWQRLKDHRWDHSELVA